MRKTLAALCLVLPVAAAAQPSRTTDVKKMVTDDCARARAANKTCVLSIEGIDVEGVGPKLDEIRISIAELTTSQSLIRLRRDFITEIVRTAEQL